MIPTLAFSNKEVLQKIKMAQLLSFHFPFVRHKLLEPDDVDEEGRDERDVDDRQDNAEHLGPVNLVDLVGKRQILARIHRSNLDLMFKSRKQ
jgi:hypothetical protein